jgi:peptide/nickel transport system permease protein
MSQELPVGELAQEPGQGGPPSGRAGSRRLSGAEGFRLFRQSKLAMLGIFIIVAVVLFCFVGPLVYHTEQVATNLQQADLPPGPGHPLGTTPEGYDVLGRLMVGGQSSIELGLSVAVISTVIGTAWGAVAGYVGGIVDATAMRIVDAILAIPALVYLLILVNIFRPTLLLLIVIISLLSWLYPARLVRAETLKLREQQYVEAVRVAGGRRRRIIARHIVPNSLSVIAVSATFQVADSILLLALLSFLGLGLPPPAATWGGMLSEGLQYIYQGYWWLVYPAAFCIVITTVAFNFMGDALRDSLDVRLHQL